MVSPSTGESEQLTEIALNLIAVANEFTTGLNGLLSGPLTPEIVEIAADLIGPAFDIAAVAIEFGCSLAEELA